MASTTVQITASAALGKLNLPVGELVEVRSDEEILATLRRALTRLASAPGPGKRGQAGDGSEPSRSGRRCD